VEPDGLNGHRIGVYLSGNLAGLAAAVWLARARPTKGFIADIGQAPPDRLRALARDLHHQGLPTVVVDLREAIAECALDLVKYDAQYEGGYWNTTSASRWVLVRHLAPVLHEAGCQVLAHGSVDGGNDQQRFTRYTAQHGAGSAALSLWAAPELADAFPGRADMLGFVSALGLAPVGSGTVHSEDVNLAGASLEGVELEDLATPSSDAVRHFGDGPLAAPDKPESVMVRIEGGRPVGVGATHSSDAAVLTAANTIGALHGLGLCDTVENRINGTKCRGVYEAPGLELLAAAARAARQATMDRAACRLFQLLSRDIGISVYEGRADDTATRAARTAIDLLVANTSATVRLDLYKGSVVARALTEVAHVPGVARQVRLGFGGSRWHVLSAPHGATPH
jgi:argininosuccinate synthase